MDPAKAKPVLTRRLKETFPEHTADEPNDEENDDSRKTDEEDDNNENNEDDDDNRKTDEEEAVPRPRQLEQISTKFLNLLKELDEPGAAADAVHAFFDEQQLAPEEKVDLLVRAVPYFVSLRHDVRRSKIIARRRGLRIEGGKPARALTFSRGGLRAPRRLAFLLGGESNEKVGCSTRWRLLASDARTACFVGAFS